MSRKHYNDLRNNLKDSFKKSGDVKYGYGVMDGVGNWVRQSGIRSKPEHSELIIQIFNAVPYPYQQEDRTYVLNFLHTHRYGAFKVKRSLT